MGSPSLEKVFAPIPMCTRLDNRFGCHNRAITHSPSPVPFSDMRNKQRPCLRKYSCHSMTKAALCCSQTHPSCSCHSHRSTPFFLLGRTGTLLGIFNSTISVDERQLPPLPFALPSHPLPTPSSTRIAPDPSSQGCAFGGVSAKTSLTRSFSAHHWSALSKSLSGWPLPNPKIPHGRLDGRPSAMLV